MNFKGDDYLEVQLHDDAKINVVEISMKYRFNYPIYLSILVVGVNCWRKDVQEASLMLKIWWKFFEMKPAESTDQGIQFIYIFQNFLPQLFCPPPLSHFFSEILPFFFNIVLLNKLELWKMQGYETIPFASRG